MNDRYKDQVSLLIRTLPVIAREPDLALHGGTAINLFIKEMPVIHLGQLYGGKICVAHGHYMNC